MFYNLETGSGVSLSHEKKCTEAIKFMRNVCAIAEILSMCVTIPYYIDSRKVVDVSKNRKLLIHV